MAASASSASQPWRASWDARRPYSFSPSWRRGRTLSDIAEAEQVTLPFVSRTIWLAYLSPVVLERLLLHRRPCVLPLDKLAAVAIVPRVEQPDIAFDD